MGFGLLIAFSLVGALTGHLTAAAAFMIMTSVMWAAMRILREGVQALHDWHYMSAGAKVEKRQRPEPPSSPTP